MIGVDLQRGVALGSGGDQRVDVRRQTLATIDHASSRMANDVHQRMADRTQHSRGGCLGLLLELAMRRGDDDVEFRQQVILIIERAIRQNVHFAARQYIHALVPLGGFAHRVNVLEQSLRR